MPSDPIMDLHAQGLSAREIGECTGKTRNAVLGYIWRFRRRNGPVTERTMPTENDIRDAMRLTGGNVTAAARHLGVSTNYLTRRGIRNPCPRKQNRAKDVITRALVDEITASGLTDRYVSEHVGMSIQTIRDYRRGKRNVSPDMAKKVRAVLFNTDHYRSRDRIPASVYLYATQTAFMAYGLTDKARSVAMYLLSVTLGYGPTNTAKAFDCGHGAVAAAATRVEEWRDDPDFDTELTALEQKNSPGY